MNDLRRLAQAVLCEIPDARLDLDEPERSQQAGWLDVRHGDLWVAVEWRPPIGFGVSLVEQDPGDFAGGAAEGGFLVVGAKSRSGVARFYEELIRINNEQANALRAAMKDVSLQARAQVDRESRHYDELSQLNNDLATTQRELAKSNVELGRLNDQKNQFLGMAAHDLRNPLEVILTYSQFLLEEAAPSLPRDQAMFIETIRSSSEFMLHLVEDLLDLTRIESGRRRGAEIRVDSGPEGGSTFRVSLPREGMERAWPRS